MRKTAILGIIIIFADRITKLLIRGTMIYGESVRITDFFRITYIENTGIAWGIFNSYSYSNFLFIIANLAALAFLVVKYTSFSFDQRATYGWVMVVSGAFGNLFDRIFVGGVVDFLDFRIFGYDFPVFNIADSAITVGGFLIAAFFIKKFFKESYTVSDKISSAMNIRTISEEDINPPADSVSSLEKSGEIKSPE